MNSTSGITPECEVNKLRGVKFLRGLHRILPLGRKLHPLMSFLNPQRGMLLVPFGLYEMHLPAAWRKPITTTLLLQEDIAPEFRLLSPLCRQIVRGCLVDMGANVGLYTLLMRAKSACPIIAYEPQPFLCDLLRRNVAHNHLPDIEVRNVACGAKPGEVPFYVGTNGSVAIMRNAPDQLGLNSFGTSLPTAWEGQARKVYHGDVVIKVPVVTLDNDLADRSDIALLKIDCEGFEYDILQGAKNLIERHHPQLFIEIHPAGLEKFGHSTQALIEILRPLYKLEFWCFQSVHRNKLLRSLAKFRVARGFQYANEEQMLDAVKQEPRPSQIYCVGRPKARV